MKFIFPCQFSYQDSKLGVLRVGVTCALVFYSSHCAAMFGNSKHIDQGMDADLVPIRVLTQTRIDVIFKKEMETRSKLSKAWAKWFRSNGVPGNKADCPRFRNALKLTQQLGTRFVVPTGDEIDGANLDASDEELP